MSRYLPLALGATLTLLLAGPASADMLGGFRLGGASPEGQAPAGGLVKNEITFVLGSDGPGPGLLPDDESDGPSVLVDDSSMLFARVESFIPAPEGSVPEPTALLMLGTGLLVAGGRLRRR